MNYPKQGYLRDVDRLTCEKYFPRGAAERGWVKPIVWLPKTERESLLVYNCLAGLVSQFQKQARAREGSAESGSLSASLSVEVDDPCAIPECTGLADCDCFFCSIVRGDYIDPLEDFDYCVIEEPDLFKPGF